MLTTCAEPGCDTFVLGGFCLQHEVPQTRIFVRGRPFVPRGASLLRAETSRSLVRTSSTTSAVEARRVPEFVLR